MHVLSFLFGVVREFVLLAASAGVAWWCWDQFRGAERRQDDNARGLLAAERQAADAMQLAVRLDDRTAAIADRLEEIAAAGREAEARAAAKSHVHALLQSTGDPFLSFSEIERALDPADAVTAEPANPPLAGAALRRVLIELVGDGVVAQLDRDRYFIASDYDAEHGEDG